jgi:radical SAM superfamily enzyme YgiQ (UPF0313 family)
MLLINPPVVRPCEAPAGIARLAGYLRARGQSCYLVDMNLEGLLDLVKNPPVQAESPDTWTRRALKNRLTHLEQLTSWMGYGRIDQYGSAVRSLNRVLATGSAGQVSLTNYADQHLSPVRSADLLRAAAEPETNPFYPYFSQRLSSLIEEKNPRIIGISLNYLTQALCTFAIIGFLRKHNPEIKIILGGGLVTSWLSRADWHNPFKGWVDEIVAGPGEPYLDKLLSLETKQVEVLPDYEGLPLGNYLAPGFILPYSTSQGCWWRRCAFCPEKAEETVYRPIPHDQVMTDLRMLVSATRPVLIHFLDNALSPAMLKALIKDPPGVPWYGFVRFTPELNDADFCRALKASGCVMLKLGLESGDQDVLDSLEKGIDLREAAGTLKWLHEAGIGTYVYLLFGTPAEALESAEHTLDFICRHGDWMDYLNVAIFNLPVFSREAEALDTFPFYEGDLSLYANFRHPRGWSRGRVRQFLDKEFKRHPAIAPILRRDPPCFTSNHAPLFLLQEKRKRKAVILRTEGRKSSRPLPGGNS